MTETYRQFKEIDRLIAEVEGRNRMMKFPVIRKLSDFPKPTREKKLIFIHHSASSFGSAELFHHWHINRPDDPFRMLGYHAVVNNGTRYPAGYIQLGRPIDDAPAANPPNERNMIAFCVVGDFSALPLDNNLDARAMSAALIVTNYMQECGIEIFDEERIEKKLRPRFGVYGHRERNVTQCPGLNIDMAVMRKYFLYWLEHFDKLVDWYENHLFLWDETRDQVAMIQYVLNTHYNESLVIDGWLGPKTHGAWTDAVGVETYSSRAGTLKGWELLLELIGPE